MKNKKTKKVKGFTLVELMVSIAIMGIMASLILVSISSARGNARDARRTAELGAVSRVLEIYYIEKGVYPDCNGNCSAVGGGDIYGVNFNNMITYLRSQNYISEADYKKFVSSEKEKKSWIDNFIAMASVGPMLDPSSRPQDPNYTDKYYEYSVNGAKSGYRIRASFEGSGGAASVNALSGDFSVYGDSGCNMTVKKYCIGSDSFILAP
jgi:prepilin-type N-terminal cleavage/methylation domain-containing protein